MAEFDLVIRGGTVVDGTGAEPRLADVAVRDGIVVEVGEIDGAGREEIDATGRLVTPGFVDVHTHYDGQATWENRLVPSTNHGVTTVVMGNCGVGFAPCEPEHRDLLIKLMEGVEDIPNVVLCEGVDWQWTTYPEYLDYLAGREFDADVCSYVPHAALRTYVMGERAFQREPATEAEIERMGQILEEAIGAGAFGFGTSQTMFHRSSDGQLTPTLAATEQEYAGLTAALGRAGAGLMQFVMEYSGGWERLLDTSLQQTADAGRAFSMSLVQSHGMPDLWRAVMAKLDAVNAAGGEATMQVLPRPLGVLLGLELTLNPFYSTPTYLALADRPLDERVRELRRPEVKEQVLAEVNDPNPTIAIGGRVRDFDHLFEMGEDFDYEPPREASIGAQARRLGVTPESLAYDRLLDGDGSNILYLAFSNYADYSLEPSREMLLGEHTVPGLGDGGAHLGVICDGSIYTHMLAHWGRDRTRGDRLPLSYLIHLMSQRSARTVGLHDRGVVAPGYRADLNIIDLDRLGLDRPRVVRDLPAGGRRLMQDARGYAATIVAGDVVTRDGIHTGALPGRLVRGPQSGPTAA
ncbi:N-acyl-D-amino-acid deacylase family protein [Gordonia neofelifaecis]|uniref:Amidohydrolase family protein/D-aminoacylase domain-containing protein n=1 Tax=Gordonia neofelifaecis NRRL B-59395 TaxID=644548 RepID=F1YE10_9ACTN|nr:amidohydrolase family protein [Gordonia neofelifaecis]EGD57100.1 amidohydrolase family protein/D-aminoacylase domain-containing protein [Gordonia neofelifaecis NRRL B-59395]